MDSTFCRSSSLYGAQMLDCCNTFVNEIVAESFETCLGPKNVLLAASHVATLQIFDDFSEA